MSNDARRQSKEIEELIRLNSGSCSSPNRDMRLSLGLLTECFAQCRADLIDLRFGHRGEERQGQGALSYALGNRELAPFEAEALAVGRQQVDAGQIRLGGDPIGCQRLDHRGAIGPIRQLHAEDETAAPLFDMVLAGQDDVVAVVLAGRLGANLSEPLAVERRDVVPGIEHLVEPLQLGDSDGGVQVAHPVVEAQPVVLDPKNAVEEDACARYDLRQQPGQADQRVQQLDQKLGTTLHGDQTVHCKWSTGGPAGSNPSGGNPGYTGMEGLLNYAYVQTNSLNLFDELGHALGITLVSAPGGNNACGYQTGPSVPDTQGSSGNLNTTRDPRNFAECAGILGDRQPGINYGVNPSGLFGSLGSYDPSVCPDGSDAPTICNPADAPHTAASLQAAGQPPAAPQQQAQSPQAQQKGLKKLLPPGVDPSKLPDKAKDKLKDLLPQLPSVPLPPVLPNSGAPSGSATDNLLNFLLGQ